jgi:CBS domain-containing protein
MPTSAIIALLTLGAVLVVGSLLLRVFSGGRHEIKTTDLVFLVIPLLVVALATGKLKGIDIFGVKADLSELWAAAVQTKIAGQVAPAAPATVQDAVQVVELGTKGGIQELRRLIERKIQALEFKLGHSGYYGPAIKTYFEALSGSSSLRVIVVDKPDGKLFGMYDAADLIGYLRVAGEQGYEQFQKLLNSGSEAARAELAKLPGFVGADHAVTAVTSKRDALARMEQLNVDILPVVDEQQRFVGTVERAKLTASLILAVTDKLESR